MRLFFVLCCVGVLLITVDTPQGNAEFIPWFSRMVGNAHQVISVVGIGHSQAKMDIYERSNATWRTRQVGIPTHIGSAGMTPQAKSGYPATPMGVFTLPFAFGTAPNPGSGLPYVRVGSSHWWDGDDHSPTFNTMQVCQRSQCPFNTADSENLNIPQYRHAIVMGVNPKRIPGQGSAFFFHTTDGNPTAGCVAIEDRTLVHILQWLRPGAVIAIAQ